MEKQSKEALCVADADSMAHFDAVASLFFLAFQSHKMGIEEANDWLLSKLTRSYNKLSPQAKAIIKPKLEAARRLLQ